MTDKVPATYVLPHVRAAGFQEYVADGFFSRVEAGTAVLTFYQNDIVVTHENMALEKASDNVGTYTTTGFTEVRQRVQLFALRIPVEAVVGALELMQKRGELS